MNRDPQYRVDVKRTPGKLQLIIFALFVIAALICEYLLLDVREGEQTALSGELLQGGYGAIPTSFWGRMFEYFGSVVYLLPLLLLLPVWWILNSSFSLKQVDFFKVGLRLLGFNTLIIGLCTLFAGIFTSDPTGAGGTLGEVLYLFSFSRLPAPAAAALPVALTFVGAMLFGAHSPWWFCDRIGAAVARCIPFLNKDEGKDQSDEKPKEKPQAVSEKAPRHTFSTVFRKKNAALQEPEVKQPEQADGGSSAMEHDAAPSKSKGGIFQAPRFFRGKDDVQPKISTGLDRSARVEPSFDSVSGPKPGFSAISGVSAAIPSGMNENVRTAVQDDASGRADVYASGGTVQNSYAKIEPAMRHRQVEQPVYPEEGPGASGSLADADPHAPSTIISGGAYASAKSEPQVSAEVPRDEYVMPDAPASTIITHAGSVPQQEKQDVQEAPGPDPRPSSIITHAGEQSQMAMPAPAGTTPQEIAPAVDADTVGNPFRRGSVSTVITRNEGVERMQFDQEVQQRGMEDRDGGYYTEKDSGAYIPSSPGTLMDSQGEDQGYFSFDEPPAEESHGTQREPKSALSQPLSTGTAPMSERDSAFSSALGNATRGLQHDQQKPPAPEQEPAENFLPDEELQPGEEFPKEDYPEALPSRDEDGSFVKLRDFDDGMHGIGEDAPDYGQEAQSEPDVPEIQVPVAPLGRIPTKTYVSSTATVPSGSDPDDNWRPPFDLLKASGSSEMVDRESIENMIFRINKTMQDFGIQAEVASYQAGPVITRYDLKLGRGTRISAIRQLQMDLTRVLTAQVRVLDVIPGTPYSGLEIPNPKRKLITLRDVVESEEFAHTGAGLPLCLGVNTTGGPVVADLAKAPHLLIAGTTGSGKSAGINSMLLSLLLTKSPSELRLILVDPKQVEFSLYADLPHLICPVISESSQTMAALQWCVGEMERRYKLISGLKLRSIGEVNAFIRQENSEGRVVYDPAWTADMGGSPSVLKPIPAIVMVIDEFADLMDAYRAKSKNNRGQSPDVLVGRIAQKARAAGMHLMLATQSPRSNVVTGVLKSNLPSRIAYTVQSALDSRVILDESGAEALLGNGDMLAKLMGLQNNQLFRAHGPFASNDDVAAVVEAWHEHCGDPEFLEGVSDADDEEDDDELSSGESERTRKKDVLYDEVLEYCHRFQSSNDGNIPSISGLQVEFGIGYGRAKRLMVTMKKNGDLIDG